MWVRVAVPTTQPAPLGEAVGAQQRPGAQLCWENLVGRCGISAICSSRDRLSFCQSHSEGRSWLPPSQVRALCLQPVEPDAETLLARTVTRQRRINKLENAEATLDGEMLKKGIGCLGTGEVLLRLSCLYKGCASRNGEAA